MRLRKNIKVFSLSAFLVFMVLLVCFVPLIRVTHATTIFSSGWEDSGGTDVTDGGIWTGTQGSPTVSASDPYAGTYHLSVTNAYNNVYKTVSVSEFYFQAEMRWSANPSSSEELDLIRFDDNANSRVIANLILDNYTGTVRWILYYEDNGVHYAVSTQQTNPAINTYHNLTVRAKCSTTVAEYQVWIDGSELTDIAQTGKNSTSTTFDRVIFGITWETMVVSVTVYGDNCVGADAPFEEETPPETITRIDGVPYSVISKINGVPTSIIKFGFGSVEEGDFLLSELGDDYLIFQGNTGTQPNGVPSSTWTSGKLTKLTDYDCHAVRLLFAFTDFPTATASYYNYTKMNQVLDILDSVGIKGILVGASEGNGLFGSTAFVNDWVQMTTDFEGDSRVAAFCITQEPWSADCSSSGPVGAINSMAKVHQFMAYLIDAIRAVDSSRTILYPVCTFFDFYSYGYPPNWTQFYADLQTYSIPAKGNIVYDVLHAYFWEYSSWDNGYTNATDRADNFYDDVLAPAISVFGANNICVGETFPWSSSEIGPSEEYYTNVAQIAFGTQFVNNCVSAGINFELWCYFSRQSAYSYTSYDTVIENSNYQG